MLGMGRGTLPFGRVPLWWLGYSPIGVSCLGLLGVVDGECAVLLFVFDINEAFDAFNDHSDASDEEHGAGEEFVAVVDDGVDGNDEQESSCGDEEGAECDFYEVDEHWCLSCGTSFRFLVFYFT